MPRPSASLLGVPPDRSQHNRYRMTYQLAGPDFSLTWLTAGSSQISDIETSSYDQSLGGDTTSLQQGSREKSDLSTYTIALVGGGPDVSHTDTDHWLEAYSLTRVNGQLQAGHAYSLSRQQHSEQNENTWDNNTSSSQYGGSLALVDWLVDPYSFSFGLQHATGLLSAANWGNFPHQGAVTGAAVSALTDTLPTGAEYVEGEEYSTYFGWTDDAGHYHVYAETAGGTWTETVYEDETQGFVLSQTSGTLTPSPMTCAADTAIVQEEQDRSLHPATPAPDARTHLTPPDPADPAQLEHPDGLADQYGELDGANTAQQRQAARTGTDGADLDQAHAQLDGVQTREQGLAVTPAQVNGEVDYDNVPKGRMDALISKGYAKIIEENGQEVVVVTGTSNGQDWKFVFARNTKLHVGSEGAAWVETLDSYRLVGSGPGTMSSQALADVTFFQRPADTGVLTGMEFVLHVLPGGTEADYFVNGHGTRRDVIIATVGDAAFVVGLWAKTARGARALWLAGGAAALEAGTGLYAGGQGVYYLSQGDLTGATRSGIEAMLILWGLKGDLEDVITRLKTPKLTNDAANEVANAAQKTALGDVGPRRALTAADVTAGMEINPAEVNIYRGGSSLRARPIDFKVDPTTGMLKTTHGLSLDVSAEAMSRFGGAFRIESIPAELRIIQRGGKLGHFEIVPRTPMTPQRFQELLDQIKLVPAT